MTAELDLGRTRDALADYDAHHCKEVDIDGVDGWWKRSDTLLIAIGIAFATDTADRNEPETARTTVNCPAGLGWIRRLCDNSSEAGEGHG